jgi:hypothetical protein
MTTLSENEILSKWTTATGCPPKRVGKEWRGRCPIHEADGMPHRPSCDMTFTDGKAIWACRSRGCESGKINEAILGRREPSYTPPRPKAAEPPPAAAPKKTYASADDGIAALSQSHGRKPDMTWRYRNADGEHVGTVLRWSNTNGTKDILPLTKQSDGSWACAAMPEPRPLYRLPELLAAPMDTPIYFSEGEKCCDALEPLGLLAVTTAGGAKAPAKTDLTPLAGRTVYILPDADAPGEKYAADVAGILHGLGCKVKIVRLPGLPDGGDIVDYLAALPDDGLSPEQICEDIQATANKAAVWQPAASDTAKKTTATPAEPTRSILELCHNVAGLLSDPQPLAEPIIDGGLRRGEVGLWVGATKTAKSWSIMHWHIAVATGGQCFNYQCRRGPSLMIDCELALSTNTHRLKRVAELYGEPDLSSVELVSFRENPITIDGLIPMLEQVPPRRFDFITIDPIFKLLPADADENNNAFVASFFARLIALATKLDCAILCVHHTSKGLQSGKAVSDLGAGAGAQSRAVDWHCGLREHAEAGCVSLHTLCRSFPPSEPSVWELTPPSMTARPELDPESMKQPKPRKAKSAEPAPEKPEKPNWETIAKLANEDPHDAAWFAANMGLSERKSTELLRQAAAKKRLHLWRPKNPRDPHQWATVPQPLTG